MAVRAAREQETGEIRANDEQHEPHGAEQRDRERHGQRRAIALRSDDAVRSPLRLRFGIARLESLRDRAHLGVGCLERDAGCEARDDAEVALVARDASGVRRERNPQLGEFRKLESRRHHADDGVRDAVHANGLLRRCGGRRRSGASRARR